jgi:hypothetical protein
MLRRLVSLGAAALAGLTAACEDGPATVAGTWRSPAAWSSMVYATADGPMLVEVFGAPFATAPELRAQVAEAMTGQVIGRVTRFTADREAVRHPRFRVVVAFNPPTDLDAHALCAGPVPTAAEPREKITVLAAFCDGGALLSSTSGWVARVDGPGDKRFRRLLSQVVRDLFPEPR